MFCIENRIPRELFWAGFGFQIWCQLLTHITRAKDDTILIVDEPEIYLHPDVQRQLLNILREAGPDILLATHSTEIMGEADHSEILLVDKKKKSAHRLKDIEGVQQALDIVGSIQNITLTQLARNRRLVFVEGLTDFRIIRRFALKLGLHELASGIDLTPVESGGFSSWESILSFAQVFEKAVGRSVNIGVVYDRDYLPQEQVNDILADLERHLELAHIHERKEIENYLLIPAALERAIKKGVQEREKRSGQKLNLSVSISNILEEVTIPIKGDIQAQYIAKRSKYFEHSKIDSATINAQTIKEFEAKWAQIETRMEIVPGKEVIKRVREISQTKFAVNLTENKIIDEINNNEIPSNLMQLINKLESYRKNETPDEM
jgi:energy-coupling factor transporter ATP-binding protein EcfA2